MKSQTDWTLGDGTKVTQTAVANFLGISDRQLRSLITEMPQHAKNNLPDALAWYFQKDLMIADEDGNVIGMDDLKQQKLFHDTRKVRHDANRSKINEQKEQHELDITKGVYVERERVEHRIADISKALSKKLFALPSRVVSLIMQAQNAPEITKILNAELRKITQEIDNVEIFN